jgi:AcrR family transcriptional regulator
LKGKTVAKIKKDSSRPAKPAQRMNRRREDEGPSRLTKGERTRLHILEAAIRIIATKGIENTTTREIAAEAGVANGLVSHYIKRREDLFKIVIGEIAARAYASIEAPPDDVSGVDKILWMVDANLRFFLEHPDFAKCFLLFYYYAALEPELNRLNAQLVERALDRLGFYWKQHWSEVGAPSKSANARLVATILHNHLQSSIIKRFTLPVKVSDKEYRTASAEQTRELIEKLATGSKVSKDKNDPKGSEGSQGF